MKNENIVLNWLIGLGNGVSEFMRVKVSKIVFRLILFLLLKFEISFSDKHNYVVNIFGF